MSIKYHGDSRRGNKFWVYPKDKSIVNKKWDTHNLKDFCCNFKYHHTFTNLGIQEYECLGHKENNDILITILAKDKEACLPFYLNCIYTIDYDKKHLHLYIRTNDNNDKTKELLLDFIGKYGKEYASVYYDDSSINNSLKKMGHREWNATRFNILGNLRQESINYAIKHNLHYFVSDCDNFITPNILKAMMKNKNKKVIGPMLPTKTGYSNFHYIVDDNGYFAGHDNYIKLLHKEITGIIPVEVIHCTYFINNNTLNDISYNDGSGRHEYVVFSDVLRKKNIQQYLLNDDFYGMLEWYTEKESVNKDLQDYWKWALPAFDIPDDFFK